MEAWGPEFNPHNSHVKSWCARSVEEAETNDPCGSMASLLGLPGKPGVPLRGCLKKTKALEEWHSRMTSGCHTWAHTHMWAFTWTHTYIHIRYWVNKLWLFLEKDTIQLRIAPSAQLRQISKAVEQKNPAHSWYAVHCRRMKFKNNNNLTWDKENKNNGWPWDGSAAIWLTEAFCILTELLIKYVHTSMKFIRSYS